MTQRRLTVIVLVAAVVAVGLGVLLLRSGIRPPPPAAAPPAAAFKPTGNYADDWQVHCAPLAGPAQTACTTRLDSAYGKTDASPVPVPVPGGGGY